MRSLHLMWSIARGVPVKGDVRCGITGQSTEEEVRMRRAQRADDGARAAIVLAFTTDGREREGAALSSSRDVLDVHVDATVLG